LGLNQCFQEILSEIEIKCGLQTELKAALCFHGQEESTMGGLWRETANGDIQQQTALADRGVGKMIEIDEPSTGILQRRIVCGHCGYVITARPLGGGWFAEWTCDRCGKRGVNSVIYAAAKTALDMTAKCLTTHACRLG
jgi:hypothetical protein